MSLCALFVHANISLGDSAAETLFVRNGAQHSISADLAVVIFYCIDNASL